MTKVYVMATCPDCFEAKAQLSNNPEYQIIDIGEHVRNLKEFLRLRDSSEDFSEVRAKGQIGIPCFVSEDGSISFECEILRSDSSPDFIQGASCSLDGKGC